MNTHKFVEKRLAVGIIVLFFVMSFIPSAEAVVIKTGKNMLVEHTISEFYLPLNKGPEPIPFIEGIMGENNWYVSEVIITFNYDPERVQEIQYYLDGDWHLYTEEGIHMEDDGVYNVPWFWVDELGEPHNGWPIDLTIDQTPPSITLTKKSGLNDKVTFTADVNDPTSGVERVEFYLDNELQETLTSGPYQWVWTGTTSHSVYAIAYDYAGHSKKSDTLNTPYNFVFSNSVIYNLLQRLNCIMFTF